MTRRRQLLAWAAALPTALAAGAARAQAAWPSKPLRILVVYPPGGTSDAVARLLAERLQPVLGQPVVVENRPGASGTTGIDALAKSAPDGHTLAFSAISPLTLSPHLGKLPYDALKDLLPVAQVMYSPVYLLATPAFAGKGFAEMVAAARAAPGRLRWGTSGTGSVGHVMLEQLQRKARLEFVHVPYKGGGQVINDAVGGQFELLSANPSPAVNGQIAAGKLRLLAVAAPARLPAFADVPTLAELGHAEANLSSVFGLFAPARTPVEVVRRLNAELNKILATAELRERLAKLDNVVATATPEAFAALVQREHEATGRVIREAGIKAD